MSRILIVDDDSSIRRSFTSILGDMGLPVIASGTGRRALDIIKKGDVSLVFLDLRLPDMSGIEVLKEIKDIDESILVIIITGYATVESAVEAIHLGAYDYIKKPFKSDAVKVITKLALEKVALIRQVESLHLEKALQSTDDEMIGACDEMIVIGKQIAKVAGTVTTILIEGESGTGKELIVKSIHKLSKRSLRPLIDINCSAVPENLLESEFFGYEKGAFTGAFNRKRGLLEQANGGTLHLDEVGDMPLALQAKMLRILEERKFRRVGGTGEIGVDIRVVASTNKNLSTEIEKERFRLDLYYRLNTFLIKVPPLRERGNDIILLTNYWLEKNNLKFSKNVQSISDEAQKLLLSYPWPGNVRELKNVIERTVLLLPAEVTILMPEHITLEGSPDAPLAPKAGLLSHSFAQNFQLDKGLDYYQVAESITNEVKNQIIERALQLTGGNRTKAAKALHLSRSALWREMEKIRRWQNRSVSGQSCSISK